MHHGRATKISRQAADHAKAVVEKVSNALLKENATGYNNREHNIYNEAFRRKYCLGNPLTMNNHTRE